MLSRSLRRAALDTRWHLPPTFLCPWTANLTTQTHSPTATSSPPPSITSSPFAKTEKPVRPPPQAKPSTSLSAAKPAPLSESITSLLPSLVAQSSQHQLYITVHLHAHGFLVTQGDTIRLPFLLRDVEPGDVLRLNRAVNLGSRDFTLRAPAKERRGKSLTTGTEALRESVPVGGLAAVGAGDAEKEHFVPYLMQGRIPYLDERLFVCRAVVMGVEAEPMRVLEKTKRRQRHVKHVKSKHKYTVLKIKELRVRTLEEIEAGEVD